MGRKKINTDTVEEIVKNTFKSKITVKGKKLSDKQQAFHKIAMDEETKIIFVSGPAGSTKTYMAVFSALRHLQKNEDLDLLYVRTAIESADKGLGALPGTLEEKFNPYMAPLEDKLDEMLPQTTPIKGQLAFVTAGEE